MDKENKWISGLVVINTVILLGTCVGTILLGLSSYLLQTQVETLQDQFEQVIFGDVYQTNVDSTNQSEEPRNLGPLESNPTVEDQPALEAENETEAEENGIVTKMPNSIIDAVVADGGKYIVLRMQSMSGLAIYDTAEKEIIKTLRFASDNFLFAAGGNTVLVYYPENNLLQTWKLDTFENVLTKPNPKGATITRMTMGHSNGYRALIRYADGTNALDRASIYLLDTTNLQEIPLGENDTATIGHNRSYRDFIHQRTDGSLRVVSEWATSHTPTGLTVMLLSNNSLTLNYEHASVGYIAVGDDGLIYTQSGSIFNSQLTQIADLSGTNLIPGIGGMLFLGIADNGSMQVYASGSTTPLGPAGNFPRLDIEENYRNISQGWSTTPYVFDRHIIFDPTHGYIVLIPPENDRIIQRDFDLEQLLAEAGVDYLIVTSTPSTTVTAGETWEYEINALSNHETVAYSLEFGPDGMEISNEGKITWEIPANHTGGTESVVVLVENENNDSTYQNFDLQVSPRP